MIYLITAVQVLVFQVVLFPPNALPASVHYGRPQRQSNASFEILDAVGSLFRNDKYSYYRIRTASRHIKYLAFRNSKPALPDIRGEQLDTETLPEGDWTIGYLALKDSANRFALKSIAKVSLPSIGQAWCPRTIDYLDICNISPGKNELQCYGKGPYAMVCDGHFGADQAIVHFEWNPESICPIDHYTNISSLIDGYGIGPRFLALVTENHSRAIGYMMEKIHGRYATSNDLEACRAVLSKLHSLGLLHGRLYAKNFIITEDGRALLHEFGTCHKSDDSELLNAEMVSLEEALQQEVHYFEPLNEELGDQAVAMLERDGGLHPAVILQAHKEGKIVATESEHRDMLAQLERWRP